MRTYRISVMIEKRETGRTGVMAMRLQAENFKLMMAQLYENIDEGWEIISLATRHESFAPPADDLAHRPEAK